MVDQFHQNALENIRQEGSKLRTYALYKKNIGLEDYLIKIKNVATRTQVTKFRLSNHRLAIEKGRHEGIQLELRFCPFCKNKIENEVHFITDCHTYAYMRQELYNELAKTNPSFRHLPPKDIFIFILENTNCEKVASFIYRSLELREFLLMNPRGKD